jgi:hypothetical protein
MDIHGYIHYPTYWIYPWISMDMDIHCRVLFQTSHKKLVLNKCDKIKNTNNFLLSFCHLILYSGINHVLLFADFCYRSVRKKKRLYCKKFDFCLSGLKVKIFPLIYLIFQLFKNLNNNE